MEPTERYALNELYKYHQGMAEIYQEGGGLDSREQLLGSMHLDIARVAQNTLEQATENLHSSMVVVAAIPHRTQVAAKMFLYNMLSCPESWGIANRMDPYNTPEEFNAGRRAMEQVLYAMLNLPSE